MKRQPLPDEVRDAVRSDPSNALAIIQEASGKECPYGWHTINHATQYVPIEVEREVTVVKVETRPEPYPVPDPAVEFRLRTTEKELERLKAQPTVVQKDERGRKRDKLSLKAQNERLQSRLQKKEENIRDLRLALHRNLAVAKELSDQGRPELVEVRKETERLLREKVVHLQDTLRRKEDYIQEVTQALIDCSTYALRIQQEVQETLRIESVESAAAWGETRRLEEKNRSLEQQLRRVGELEDEVQQERSKACNLSKQLKDTQDVFEALEAQWKQEQTNDERQDGLTREQRLVRMTKVRSDFARKSRELIDKCAELHRNQQQLRTTQEQLEASRKECTEHRAEVDRLRLTVEQLNHQMAELRREVLLLPSPEVRRRERRHDLQAPLA